MKIFLILCLLLIGFSFSNCNGSKNSNQHKIYLEIEDKDKLSIYLKKYFKLSEDRNLEIWYNTYLNKCTQFYKIENPTKDSIVNLIKSLANATADFLGLFGHTSSDLNVAICCLPKIMTRICLPPTSMASKPCKIRSLVISLD